MAGKQFPSLAHARPASSRCLLAVGALILFSAVYFLLLSPSPPRTLPSPSTTTTSFVASLDRFLGSPHHPAASSAAPEDLDAAIWRKEEARLYGDPGGAWPAAPAPLRVYVYEMPRKFTYDLLRLFRGSYRQTDNLTSNGSPVHRLIEQHSIDYWLWADLIAPESQRLLKNVIRVERQEEADIFYVPFFTTISYFLLEKQECKALYREALKWITDQPAWKRSEGRDHIIPVHHPWSFKSVRRFVKKAIWLLPDMDSTGNWYKPGQVYLEKDVILPYVPNVDLCDYKCVSETQSKRSTLLFFRGRLKRNAGGKIRSKLVTELKDAEDIVIEEGTAGAEGKVAAQNGMRKSLFCLNPAGDTPSSARLFDAIVSGCIPVIVSDELELPFEGILDYSKIALFVSSSDAVQPGWLVKYLRGIDIKVIKELQSNLVKYSRHFIYSSPAQPLGPEDLTWRMIAGKLLEVECRGLDHADALGLIAIGNRLRCISNWLVVAMQRLRHPHPEQGGGQQLVRLYGPRVKFERGASLAFNVYDWKGEKVAPALVQKLADRHCISLTCGFLHNIWFADKYEADRSAVLEQRSDGAGAGEVGIHVVSASLGFLSNFEDAYRLWAFVARFLDADFVEKERWRYTALNQKTVEV